MAASRAVDDSKRWRGRDHRQDQQRLAPELDAMLLDELRDRLTALEDVEATGDALYRTSMRHKRNWPTVRCQPSSRH